MIASNPFQSLIFKDLESIEGLDRDRVIWCGDFKAHNIIRGGIVSYIMGW